MTWLLLLSFFSNPVSAMSWNDVLRNLNSKGAPQACLTNGERVHRICSDPVKVVCDRARPDFKEEKKKALKKFSKGKSSDLLKKSYEEILAEQKILEVVHKPYLNAFSKFREPFDAAGVQWEEIEKKVAVDPQLVLLRTPYEAQKAKLEALKKKHFGLIKQLNTSLLAEFGKTPEQLAELFKRVKKTVRAAAEKNLPKFESTESSTGEEIRARALKNLDETEIEMGFDSALDGPTGFESFVRSCGYDGLVTNAFNSTQVKKVQVCPGILLAVLADSSGSLESLYGVFSHEFGHSIDGNRYLDVPCSSGTCSTEYYQVYKGFLKCIKTHFGDDPTQKFVSEYDTFRYANSKIPEWKDKLQKLKLNPKGNETEIAEIERWVGFIESRGSLDRLSHDCMTYRSEELIADSFFSAGMAERMKQMPSEQRVAFVEKAFPMFCGFGSEDPIADSIFGGMNPRHPPNDFRIENVMRNPELRELLGCAPLSPEEKPWCSLNAKSE